MAKFDMDTLGKNSQDIYNTTTHQDEERLPNFSIERPKRKDTKTLRMDAELVEKIEKLAYAHHTSFTKILEHILYDYFKIK